MPAARADSTTTNPLTPPASIPGPSPHLKRAEVIARFLAYPKVHDWLKRYPPKPQTDASYSLGAWTVHVWSGAAGEVATGTVDDATGSVTEAWTGPQVAWRMARGIKGSFGGAKINEPWLWLAFCVVFLLGLVDWRKPFGLRTLDLLALVSLSVSLWFFNHGNVFAAMPLAYPPLAWAARPLLVGRERRPSGARRAGVARVAAARDDGVPRRLPRRAQRAGVERDRRRLLGRDRRRPHLARPEPLRALPAGGRPEEVRSRGQQRGGPRPGAAERPLRDREPARRHLRAGLVPRVHPRLPAVRLEPQVGLAAVGALHVDPVRPARAARPRRRRAPPRRATSRRGRRVRLGRVAVHAVRVELEHERLDRPGSARVGLLCLDEPHGPRRGRRTLRLDEVRVAARAAALDRVSRSSAASPDCAYGSGLPRRDAGRVLRALPRAVTVARGARLLRPHGSLPGRARLAVLALGLAPVPRQGNSRPPYRAACPRRRARDRRTRARVGSAPAFTAPDGRAHRRGADRV